MAIQPSYQNTAWVQTYVANSLNGSQTVQPTTKYTKVFNMMLMHGISNYDIHYESQFAFSSGDASTVSITFNRRNPIVTNYKDSLIVDEGFIPTPIRGDFTQFVVNAEQYGIWMQKGDRGKLVDFYGLMNHMAEELLLNAKRQISEQARDKLFLGGSKHFMPKADGTAGVADKTTVGTIDWATLVQKKNKLIEEKAWTGPFKLTISEVAGEYLKYSPKSIIAAALQRYENTAGMAARLNGEVKDGFLANINGIDIYITKSDAYTYGDSVKAGETNSLGGTNNPMDLSTLGGGASVYQKGTGANNARLDVSILSAGQAAAKVAVLDNEANPGSSSLIYKPLGSSGAADPLNQKGSLGIKYMIGHKVYDTDGIHSWVHTRPEAIDYLKPTP